MKTLLAFGAFAVATATWSLAQTPPVPLPDAALERTYWHCIALDSRSAAAGERMDEASMAACSVISKELQARRFGGDFGKLHHWTQARKAAPGAKN